MKRWIRSIGEEWWLDQNPPPPDAEYPVEEVTWAAANAQAALRRIFDAGGAWAAHEVQLAEAGWDDHRLTSDQLEGLLAARISDGRLRLWRRIHRAGGGDGAAGGGQVSSERPAPPPRQSSSRPPPPAPTPTPAAGLPSAVLAPASPTAKLSWYQFDLLDELGSGLADVEVEISTPEGVQWLRTGSSGSIRVEAAPPGSGSARIDRDSLALALQDRAGRPRRVEPVPPQADDFKVVTPKRAMATFHFPDARPHRVMVISRTDIVVSGFDASWRDLTADDGSHLPCRYEDGDMPAIRLCSRALDETARITGSGPPAPPANPDGPAAVERAAGWPTYVVCPGDSLWAIAERFLGSGARWADISDANWDLLADRPPQLIHPGDRLRIPVAVDQSPIPEPGPWPGEPPLDPLPWVQTEIDTAHEALFDARGDDLFDLLAQPLRPAPQPPLPEAPAPVEAAQAIAAQGALLALQLGVSLQALFDAPDGPRKDDEAKTPRRPNAVRRPEPEPL